MTEPYVTVAEVYERYPNEWVLLDRVRVNRRQEVLGGHVLFHSGDRVEFDRLIRAVPPNTSGVMQHFASFYTGEHVLEEDVVEESEPQELRRAQ
jgi:hypothetical protein